MLHFKVPLRLLIVSILMWGVVERAGAFELSSPEIKLGERLFSETKFSRDFPQRSMGNGDLVRMTGDRAMSAGQLMSCRTCHLSPNENRAMKLAAFHPLPERKGLHEVTTRNSPSLIDALAGGGDSAPLHYDGEFATIEDLVIETFLGRNFGWLPGEQIEARRHFAWVVREDAGKDSVGGDSRRFSYTTLLRGTRDDIPAEWRLPPILRLEVATASDEEIMKRCAQLVVVYLKSQRFSRDAEGRYDGSPYDVFLAANRLPRAPVGDETPANYTRRLREAVAVLRTPRFVDDASRRSQRGGQEFRFGELEFIGMNIFFREGVGRGQTGGAGNCAECHAPPQFTDFAFHNTGVAQDDYDARHGAGAFAAVKWPRLAERNAEYERWLPPTPEHPRAAGAMRAAVDAQRPERADLGVWNIYGNPDLPKPQTKLKRLLNPGGNLTEDEVLARALGRFKTTTVRDLRHTAPYFHTDALASLEEVVEFYRLLSELARAGKLLNAPPEFFGVRLEAADVAPLVAFLRALDEN